MTKFHEYKTRWGVRPGRPLCFDSEAQWKNWKAAARDSQHRGDHCADCTPDYQRAMLAQGRCESKNVVFVIEPGEGLTGKHPSVEMLSNPDHNQPTKTP